MPLLSPWTYESTTNISRKTANSMTMLNLFIGLFLLTLAASAFSVSLRLSEISDDTIMQETHMQSTYMRLLFFTGSSRAPRIAELQSHQAYVTLRNIGVTSLHHVWQFSPFYPYSEWKCLWTDVVISKRTPQFTVRTSPSRNRY